MRYIFCAVFTKDKLSYMVNPCKNMQNRIYQQQKNPYKPLNLLLCTKYCQLVVE